MKLKIEQTLKRAFNFQKAGDLNQAADLYQVVLKIEPNQPVALHYLGIIAHQTGQFDAAVQLLVQSLNVNPKNEGALNALAGVLKDQNRFPEALEFYQAALAIAPTAAYLHSNLGVLYMEMQRLDEAEAAYLRALDLDPKSYPALSNLGSVFQKRNEWDKALDCYERALALNSQAPIVLGNIGSILNAQGRFSEALFYHEASLKIAPNSDVVLGNLGAALQKLGRGEEAAQCCQRAVELNPRSFIALKNLGNVSRDQGQFALAVVCLKKALELKPDCFQTLNSLGAALKELGLLEESLDYFLKAFNLSPTLTEDLYLVHRNLGVIHNLAGRSEEAVRFFRMALEFKPDCAETFSDLLFTLNHLQQDTPEALFAEHLRFGKQFGDPLAATIQPHLNSPDPDRRLRVGFVSGDLRFHAVSLFIEPIFSSYTKSQFEFFCYQNYKVNDEVSERLKSKVDSWCNVDSLSDEELASRIRNDQIDILVDLSGHTGLNRLPVFARKPAPVQVSMIGYIQTTGLAAIDYRITDESVDPVGKTEHLNTEKLIRLAGGAGTFRPPIDSPPVNELPALKNGYITFASFNKLSKITPEVIATWAKLLKAMPTSRLLVAGVTCDLVATSMASHGIELDRLEFCNQVPLLDYLALHHRVDFYLDTFPYTGGTTNLLALWMGIPFVTMQGDTAISRGGASLLNCWGLSDLIASNPDEYVQKAITAVQDLPGLAKWRRMLRQYLTPALCDSTFYIQQLEGAFRQIWRTWCDQVKSSA